MRNFIILSIVLLLSFGTMGADGCLVSGQITITEFVDIGRTTDTNVNKYDVNLTTNEDWQENKDKIISVDAVAIVAIIVNNLAADNFGEVFWSNNANLTTVDEVRQNSIRIMKSPVLPGQKKTLIEWKDAFQYMENEDTIINEILGDGIFTLYGIAEKVPFDMHLDAEAVITVTITQ